MDCLSFDSAVVAIICRAVCELSGGGGTSIDPFKRHSAIAGSE